jgi:hypothetical protein
MHVLVLLRQAQRDVVRSLAVFVRDVVGGLLEVSHNTLALVGLVAVVGLVFGLGRADIRHKTETVALEWLQMRQEARDLAAGNVLSSVADPVAVTRATAADLSELTHQQAILANWIARRYRVAPEPIGALVREAWSIGQRAGLDPTLLLAIMAVESSFNPFAQSQVGAQGLMQVMTRVHDDKYEVFGGTRAAFDPISNVRVGAQVLRDCINQAGSVAEGLRHYVGAALISDDGGYVNRVLAEQSHMRAVADGKRVPINAPMTLPTGDARPTDATVAAPIASNAATPERVALLLR